MTQHAPGQKVDETAWAKYQKIEPKYPVCAECRAGDHDQPEPAIALISHPNPDHPNLRVRKWVCEEHLTMLADDFQADLTMLEK